MRWHFAGIWETIADAIPDAPALAQGEVRLSWRDYEDRAARIAAGLAAAGLGPDAKVGLYAYNSNAYLEAQFGVFKGPRRAGHANYRYTEHELVYLWTTPTPKPWCSTPSSPAGSPRSATTCPS